MESLTGDGIDRHVDKKNSRIFALDNTFNFSFVERRRVYFSKDGVPPSLMARGFFFEPFSGSCVR